MLEVVEILSILLHSAGSNIVRSVGSTAFDALQRDRCKAILPGRVSQVGLEFHDSLLLACNHRFQMDYIRLLGYQLAPEVFNIVALCSF